MLVEMRALVDAGYAESSSSLVRESVARRIQEIREAELHRQFLDAAQDPEFMADLNCVMQDFTALDAETARLIPP